MKLRFLLPVLCLVPPAWGQQQANDLNGTWKDAAGDSFVIKQSNKFLTMDLRNGIVLTGTLNARTVSMTWKWTAETAAEHVKSEKEQGPQAAADRAAAIRALTGTVVTVSGTLSQAGDRLDLTYREQSGEASTQTSTTEAHASQLAPQRLTLTRVVLQPKLQWQESKDTGNHKLGIEGVDKPVVGVKYKRPSVTLTLLLEDHGKDISGKIETLVVRNLIAGKRGVVYDPSLLSISFDGALKKAVITFDSKKLLDNVKATVNTAVLEATVTVRDTPLSKQVKADSSNVLFLYLQKLIVFLPGVCGSTISIVPPTGGAAQEVFPVVSQGLVGEPPINLLECRRDGTAIHSADEIDLFRSYGVGKASSINVAPPLSQLFRLPLDTSLVYDVERMNALVSPKDHPKVTVDGNGPMRFYLMQPWPYDWRGRLENTAELMFSGRGQKVDPPYRDPPPIRRILDEKKKDNPLLDDKVALAGHSTGGVVMRGVLLHAGVTDLVDQAFFIDVPFFGAPKSYYVYLSGDMGVPIVRSSLMRNLAPNMPIVYYLAPDLAYPDAIVRDEFGHAVGIGGGGLLLTELVGEAKRAGLYPKDKDAVDGWNRDLQKAAWAYHQAVERQPAIGWDHCFIFYSDRPVESGADCSDGMTIGILKVGKKGFECESTKGDHTVPLVSQLGDFAAQDATEKIPIQGSPKHVPSPNVEYVWEQAVKRIIR